MNNLPFKIEVAGYCEGCPYFWEELNSIDVTQLDDKEQKNASRYTLPQQGCMCKSCQNPK